ncbi:MAG: uridine kinase, partial [Planctomycetes bacterium]|nr:uridine kinase [Planctomycetota bacterium]
ADRLVERLGADRAVVIPEDAYYRDLSDLSLDMRTRVNFDHPDALEHDLLATHLEQMLNGDTVSCPTYDYKTHNRLPDTTRVTPHRVIILEGILVLSTACLRDLMHIRVFVNTSLDTCCDRRIKRDMAQRGRTRESVVQQFEETVRPMYVQFVEPSKQHADLLIPGDTDTASAMDLLMTRINAKALETHD